jgi:hypothetical protein
MEIWVGEWNLHPHNGGIGGGRPWFGQPPHGGCSLPYIRWGGISLHTHLYTLSSLHFPSLVAPPWQLLSEALPQIVCRRHLEKWRRSRSSGGSLLPLPHWTEGVEDVNKPYVWQSTEVLPVVAPWLHDLEIIMWSTMYVIIDNVCVGT